MTIRTTGFVQLDGRSYPPGTVLDVPEQRGLQMVGDEQAVELPEGKFNPGGGTGHHPPQAPDPRDCEDS